MTYNYVIGDKETVTVNTDRGPRGLQGPQGPAGLGAPPSGYPVLAVNRALNPSCESLTGITIYGTNTSTRTVDATKFLFGTKSIKTVIDSGAAQSRGLQFPVAINVGKVYNISGYAWSETTVVRMNYIFRDAGGTAIGSTVEPTVGHVIGAQFNRFSGLTTAVPAGAVSMDVRIFFASGLIGNTFYTDGLLVTEGTTLSDYFDGNTPGARWTGTANNSTSELVAPRNVRDLPL
jgi:hypothetical protein